MTEKKQTILNRRASLVWLPGIKSLGTPPRKLLPGTNSVPAALWAEAKKHPAVKLMIDDRTLVTDASAAELSEGTHTPSNLDGLRDMTIPKAMPYIDAAEDVAQLERWRNADKRSGILEAIDARLETLREAAE